MVRCFQDIFLELNEYWTKQGVLSWHPYDLEKGAGTFNPATFFGVLGTNPCRVGYVEPSRRPSDGRYGKNPNRLYRHHQYQVILKPAPADVQSLYIDSLKAIGIDPYKHDIRFIEDDWESPTLGASGLGWEVRMDSMEITQFTYFQKMGAIPLDPISVELTYGLERISMYLQDKDNVYDMVWGHSNDVPVFYRDLFQQSEYEFSVYSFEKADIKNHLTLFDLYEKDCQKCLEANLVRTAYDMVLKMSHAFNILDSRNAVSVTERFSFIQRVRDKACACATMFLESSNV